MGERLLSPHPVHCSGDALKLGKTMGSLSSDNRLSESFPDDHLKRMAQQHDTLEVEAALREAVDTLGAVTARLDRCRSQLVVDEGSHLTPALNALPERMDALEYTVNRSLVELDMKLMGYQQRIVAA